MPKDTKTLGNNKARACESLGFVHKKRLCQRFDTTSSKTIFSLKIYFNLILKSYHSYPRCSLRTQQTASYILCRHVSQEQ